MKIGVCTDAARLGLVKSLGYDFAEFNLTVTSKLSDDEFNAAVAESEKQGMRIETFNNFVPADIKLSADIDLDTIRSYSNAAFARAERLGGEIIVIGSGGARRIPDGYDKNVAHDNFARALDTIADCAKAHNLKIAIEPLNFHEVNLINTLKDAYEMCQKVGREDVGYIVDLYHFYRNGEDWADIKKYGEGLIHTHLARMNEDRGAPTMDDIEDVRTFMKSLEGIGYDARMSLECTFRPTFEEAISKSADMFAAMKG